MKGVIHKFFETGTEGIYWAFQDEEFIDNKGFYSYEGLHCLKNGDYLKVFGNSGDILFEDAIALSFETVVIDNLRYHGIQKGVDKRSWAAMFELKLKAELIPAQK